LRCSAIPTSPVADSSPSARKTVVTPRRPRTSTRAYARASREARCCRKTRRFVEASASGAERTRVPPSRAPPSAALPCLSPARSVRPRASSALARAHDKPTRAQALQSLDSGLA
jgi:hypothetical protein